MLVYVGVQPFHISDGMVHLLLSRESDEQVWSNFGGGPERRDADEFAGAAREAFEESMGLMGTSGVIERNVRDRGIRCDVGFGDGKETTTFLLPVEPLSQLPEMYSGIMRCHSVSSRQGLGRFRKGFGEKDKFMWTSTPLHLLDHPREFVDHVERQLPDPLRRPFKEAIEQEMCSILNKIQT